MQSIIIVCTVFPCPTDVRAWLHVPATWHCALGCANWGMPELVWKEKPAWLASHWCCSLSRYNLGSGKPRSVQHEQGCGACHRLNQLEWVADRVPPYRKIPQNTSRLYVFWLLCWLLHNVYPLYCYVFVRFLWFLCWSLYMSVRLLQCYVVFVLFLFLYCKLKIIRCHTVLFCSSCPFIFLDFNEWRHRETRTISCKIIQGHS